MATRTQEQTAPGLVQRGVLYTLPELQARLQVKADGWRSLRRAGLGRHVIVAAGRRYLLGDHVLDFFEGLAAVQEARPTREPQ